MSFLLHTLRARYLASAVLICCAAAAPARAAAAALTLSDAVRFALLHSPSVAQQRSAVAQADLAYVKQRSSGLPNVNGSLQNVAQKSSNLQGAYAVVGLSQENVFSQNTAQIGTNYTLYTGGLSHLQTLAAREQFEQARATLRKTKNQIANDVTNAFYAIATNDEAVRLDRADLDYQRVLVEVAKAKENAGVAAGVDVLQAKASEEKSRSALVAAQAAAVDARESLAQTIGAPLRTAFAVPERIVQPPLPTQTLNRLIAIAQANRPEVASAQAALRVAQDNRRTLNIDLFPQVQLSGSFGNQFSPTAVVFGQQQIDRQFATQNAYNAAHGLPLVPLADKPVLPRGSPGFWQIQAVTTFSLPLVDYGVRHATRLDDDKQIAAAQVALDSAKSQVALDVRQDYRQAQTALAQIRYAREESRYGVESARIAKLQYQSGIVALTSVLEAEQTALSAQIDLFNARVGYVDAIVKLRVALGIYDAQSAVADLR